MSIDTMCRGTFIRRLRKTNAIGPAGGDAATESLDATRRECGAQEGSARFDSRSDGQANQANWRFYFSADPQLTVRDDVVVDEHRGVKFATSRRFHVMACKFQGSPSGGLKLWIVDGEEF